MVMAGSGHGRGARGPDPTGQVCARRPGDRALRSLAGPTRMPTTSACTIRRPISSGANPPSHPADCRYPASHEFPGQERSGHVEQVLARDRPRATGGPGSPCRNSWVPMKLAIEARIRAISMFPMASTSRMSGPPALAKLGRAVRPRGLRRTRPDPSARPDLALRLFWAGSRSRLRHGDSDRLVVWAHPAFANRHIVLRNDEEIIRVSMDQSDYWHHRRP